MRTKGIEDPASLPSTPGPGRRWRAAPPGPRRIRLTFTFCPDWVRSAGRCGTTFSHGAWRTSSACPSRRQPSPSACSRVLGILDPRLLSLEPGSIWTTVLHPAPAGRSGSASPWPLLGTGEGQQPYHPCPSALSGAGSAPGVACLSGRCSGPGRWPSGCGPGERQPGRRRSRLLAPSTSCCSCSTMRSNP